MSDYLIANFSDSEKLNCITDLIIDVLAQQRAIMNLIVPLYPGGSESVVLEHASHMIAAFKTEIKKEFEIKYRDEIYLNSQKSRDALSELFKKGEE